MKTIQEIVETLYSKIAGRTNTKGLLTRRGPESRIKRRVRGRFRFLNSQHVLRSARERRQRNRRHAYKNTVHDKAKKNKEWRKKKREEDDGNVKKTRNEK